MLYVYLIRSIAFPEHVYIGITENLKTRLAIHNVGGSFHTAKFKPWELVVFIAFKNAANARQFEKYLKSGSGRVFAKRHFW